MALNATPSSSVQKLLRVLIVARKTNWVGVSRLPAVLAREGFEVSVMCPTGALIAEARPLTHLMMFAENMPADTLCKGVLGEIQRFGPDFLIPGDDQTVRMLHQLHASLTAQKFHPVARNLLEKSLGDPAMYDSNEQKSSLVEMSERTGIAIPPSRILKSEDDAIDFAKQFGYPLILKADYAGGGGAGVVPCQDEAELRTAYGKLCLQLFPVGGKPRAIVLQKMIAGSTVTVNLFALAGKTWAMNTFIRERTYPTPYGISALVRVVDSPEMAELTRRVVEYYGFAGLGSVQFLIDERTNQPLVMELNNRPTPFAHLGQITGVDMIRAMRGALVGEPAPQPAPPPKSSHIAIFPNEWRRDPQSEALHDPAVYHDVPWDQPRLFAAIVKQTVRLDPSSPQQKS